MCFLQSFPWGSSLRDKIKGLVGFFKSVGNPFLGLARGGSGIFGGNFGWGGIYIFRGGLVEGEKE